MVAIATLALKALEWLRRERFDIAAPLVRAHSPSDERNHQLILVGGGLAFILSNSTAA